MRQVIGLGSGGNTWSNASSIIRVMRKWKSLFVNWFRMPEASFYHKKFFKLTLRWDEWISVCVNYVEK